ncbi:hypothetical protein [Pseudopedobacter sp.]|uniref:hypothetical protein n=1 Tax=Pseudopedobacter sp. TaxID=1936787 RepID=UPI00333F86A9
MTLQELVDILKSNHSKKDILDLASKVNRKIVKIRDIYNLSLEHDDPQVVFRAAWVLENVYVYYPSAFDNIQRLFLRDYSKQKNRSAQRIYSKIAMHISQPVQSFMNQVKHENLDTLIEGSFDWLIDPETPVAIQCNCMDVLCNLSKKEDWIAGELRNILEQNLLSNSPALLSRTKSVLKKLKH